MRRSTLFSILLILLLAAGASGVLAQQIHVVQSGENLFKISQRYGVSYLAIAQANNIPAPYNIHSGNQLVIPGTEPATTTQPASQPAQQQPAANIGTYVVRGGDSLATIAAKFNTTYIALAELNAIANPNVLIVGQVLIVPGAQPAQPAQPATTTTTPPAATPGTYTVQRGDNLSTIAAKFGTTYIAIAQLNNLGNLDVLHVGMVLQVPGAPPPAQPATTTTTAPADTGPPPASTANTGGFELGGQALSFSQPGKMRQARMSWVKRQVKWHGEPASNFQHVIDGAKGNGFKVLLSVIGEPGGIANNPGAYYQNFANFLAGLARGGADAIEVWNEMNIDREWPRGLISGANYTQMLRAAYNAIKSANPATMVISGAPAPTGFFQGCSTNGGDDDCFIRQMAAAGAANHMDCVGVHYNAGIVPPDATSGAPVGSSGHYSWYLPRMMNLYRSVFPTRPLCFTELGYLTGEGIGPLPGGFAWASGNTLAEQAAWLAGAVHRLRGSGFVRMFIVWNVDATQYGSDPQAGYAIVRPGGQCPSCDSLRQAMGG